MTSPFNDSEIHKIEEATFELSDSIEIPPPDIFAYNELRSCADLFRMASGRDT